MAMALGAEIEDDDDDDDYEDSKSDGLPASMINAKEGGRAKPIYGEKEATSLPFGINIGYNEE